MNEIILQGGNITIDDVIELNGGELDTTAVQLDSSQMAVGVQVIGISDIVQTVESTIDKGINVTEIKLMDGRRYEMKVRNGGKGENYELTEQDKQEIADEVARKGIANMSDIDVLFN